MQTNARAAGADHPPSTSDTSHGRVPRWPIRAGIVAVCGLVLAAPMVAAEPASAPRRINVAQADAAAPVARQAPAGSAFEILGAQALLSIAANPPTEAAAAESTAPTTTTTTTAPPPPTTAAPAPAPTPAPTPEPAPASAPVSNGGVWDRLAQCEAGGNWAANTGNGYYGGLQFSASSWRAVGGSGLPNQASRATQIAMGERLRASQGWGAWPACSRKLGLR